MTWRSLIFSSLILLSGWVGRAATVSGKVELAFSQDPKVRKHLDYSGVVVWLEPASGAAAPPAAPRHAEMLQKNKTFTPHVLAITVGATVDFPNRDFIFHNAFSNYQRRNVRHRGCIRRAPPSPRCSTEPVWCGCSAISIPR